MATFNLPFEDPDHAAQAVNGDDVNLAACLEESNKDFDTSVLFTENTAELARYAPVPAYSLTG